MLETSITETEFAAIDFESAGSAPGKTDAPIQIGITVWSLSKGVIEQWMSYIHTDEDITWAAQKVHGININDLQNAPKFALLWPTLKRLLSDRAVVAHGHGTEKRFLRSFPGHAFSPWVDTLTLSRKAWPQLSSHSLENVCDSLGISDSIKAAVPKKCWHDALFDATGSIFLLQSLIQQHSLENRPLGVLL